MKVPFCLLLFVRHITHLFSVYFVLVYHAAYLF